MNLLIVKISQFIVVNDLIFISSSDWSCVMANGKQSVNSDYCCCLSDLY